MLKKVVLFIACFVGFSGVAQELNAKVTINDDQIQQSNKQIFKTLQNSMRDFLNNTKFTSLNVNRNEQIDCNFLYIVTDYDPNTNAFVGTLQIQASRPIYNSSYSTSILNFNDRSVNFSYIEFEPLMYSESNISSNLVAVLSFYANMIIGLDADTFSKLGGTNFYQKASNIVSMSQQTNDPGWTMGDPNNRYAFVNDILTNAYAPYREAMYEYHIKGLDLMSSDQTQAKAGIANAINILSAIHRSRPNALPTRMFFDAKADEIASVFSAGPSFDTTSLVETLTRINSSNGIKWNRM